MDSLEKLNNMNEIPTAESFLSNSSMLNKKLFPKKEKDFDQAVDRMKEFAKMHVIEALNRVNENIKVIYDNNLQEDVYINEDDILNSYPLKNIK